MTPTPNETLLEQQIAQWRSYVMRRQSIHSVDVAELEDHLREQVAHLGDAGLAQDEAFLVAVKRMGDLDTLSREFALEHSERLWKQLVVDSSSSRSDDASSSMHREGIVAFAFATGAAVMMRLPELFGRHWGVAESFYARHLSLFVFPFLAAYFIWKRRTATTTVRWIAGGFAAAFVAANIYPFDTLTHTAILSVVHMPIALWLLVGVAYAGGRWNEVAGRMDFIRFTGELLLYYVLIAMGGGVLMALMYQIFNSIGINMEPYFEQWVIPCGAAGAVIIAAWLVEAKQSVIENMAPVLARLFTPLFIAVLITFLATLVFTGRGLRIEREMLLIFDLLLVLVLGLLLYSISARDSHAPPGWFDKMQIVLLGCALITDGVALSAIAARISEYGLSPNRVAVLGVNLILLVNLAWSAVLSFRFLQGRESFTSVERWQTNYLPVYAVWAAIVVIVFPPLFHFV